MKLGSLTHCIRRMSLFVNLGVSGQSLLFYFGWTVLLANNVILNPDQTPHDVAPDLDLQCLPTTFLLVFGL